MAGIACPAKNIDSLSYITEGVNWIVGRGSAQSERYSEHIKVSVKMGGFRRLKKSGAKRWQRTGPREDNSKGKSNERKDIGKECVDAGSLERKNSGCWDVDMW